MKDMKHIGIIIALLFATLPTYLCAQQDTVLLNCDTTLNSCDLILYDSGGETGNYANNTNYTITICNDGHYRMAIDIISFYTPSSTDYLKIYIGEQEIASLTGRINNRQYVLDSSCVTFNFVSDSSVNRDGFKIHVYCKYYCQEYSQNILYDDMSDEDGSLPVYVICNSSSIVSNPIFDNNNVQYEQTVENTFFQWDVISENREASGLGLNTLDSLSSGMYLVSLTMVDTAQCITNSDTMLFMVMGNPEFNLSGIPETASLYDTLVISGNVTMDGDFFCTTSSYGCIVNNDTILFPSVVQGFPDDAVISSPDDIESICVEMEHSYLGDLGVWITCPNGNSMTLFSPCGGRTYLGEPLARIVHNNVPPSETDIACMPGNPYMYCWTQDAQMTISQKVNENTTYTYTDIMGNVHTNQHYIPEGNYLPVGDWTNLVGCPMNGIWNLNVGDFLFADDGFVFSFSIQFASGSSGISADSAIYIPVFDEEDYSWDGHGILSGQNGSSTIVVNASEPGWHTYTFSATSNYGCTYDTTFSIYFCEPNLTETYITECDSLEYNGVVYHESGNYLVNVSCGNEEMLHLTLGHTTDTMMTVRNCGEYVWNNETFAESGTYTRQYQGFAGCDSVVTLNLIVGEPETIDTTLEVPCCQYEMNGYTYTEEGNYTQVLTTINGCDSIIQLSLIFTDSITAVADYKPTGTMLFPNPANNEINVVSEDLISKVEIITPIGMVVIAEEVDTKSIYLDISDLSAGGYFAVVWFKDNQNPVLLGFVKQ